jgi:hypothetical protein
MGRRNSRGRNETPHYIGSNCYYVLLAVLNNQFLAWFDMQLDRIALRRDSLSEERVKDTV